MRDGEPWFAAEYMESFSLEPGRTRMMHGWTPTTTLLRILRASLLGAVLLLSAGCATEMIRFSPMPRTPLDQMLLVGSWSGPQPTERTRLFLRMHDLESRFRSDAAGALEQVRSIMREQPTAEHLYYFAELSYVAGCRAQRSQQPDAAVQCFTATTIASWNYLFHPVFAQSSNPYDPHFRTTCDLYNSSLEKMLRIIAAGTPLLPDRQYEMMVQGERQTILSRLRDSTWKPEQIDRFEFVSDYQLEGLANHHQMYGLGVPLIAVCQFSEHRTGADRYLPPSCSFPVTALLRPDIHSLFRDGTLNPAIHPLDLFDTLQTTSLEIEGHAVSLEADFSTVLAWQLSDSDHMKISTIGLLRPDRLLGPLGIPYNDDGNNSSIGGGDTKSATGDTGVRASVWDPDEDVVDDGGVSLVRRRGDGIRSDGASAAVDTEPRNVTAEASSAGQIVGSSHDSNDGRLAGLYMVQPYEPGKIPVVMVHGLWSSPMTWMQMFNDLYADPVIRERYQFWFYLYPTALPYWRSAAMLREDLAQLRGTIDPCRRDAALDEMVLIGHSMGGLISEMQVVSSGDEVWKLVSCRTLRELQFSPGQRAMLREMFFFEPNPSVRRVVTIATPHQGSYMANPTTQWLMTKLIRWPAQLMAVRQAFFRDNPGAFPTDSLLWLESSVDSLTPQVPMHRTLLTLPTLTGLHRNNIIGHLPPQGFFKPLIRNNPGDGLVSLESASLPGAESEVEVPATHVAIHCHPQTILEVRRVLYEHLRALKSDTAVVPERVVPSGTMKIPFRPVVKTAFEGY